ncbi:MAG: FHA domain-containing protein, partial [Anaerolineae bacterium]
MSGRQKSQAELERRYQLLRGTRPDQQRTLREVYGAFDEWVMPVGQQELFLSPADGGWYYYDRAQDRTEYTGYQVGDVAFIVEGSGVRAVPSTRSNDDPSGAMLLIVAGPNAGQSFALQPESTIGRAEDNVIVLPDEQVSRHHAVVRLNGGHPVIADLGSRNGTFVNGVRISAPTPLRPGDVITIGSSRLSLRD